MIDEEERHHIDEAWRKARRTRLVREARSGNVGRRMISFWNIGQMLVEQTGALRESSGGHSSFATFFFVTRNLKFLKLGEKWKFRINVTRDTTFGGEGTKLGLSGIFFL